MSTPNRHGQGAFSALKAVVKAVALATPLFLGAGAYAAPSFVTFDSGPVRPLAMSPDGSKLFAVNTPNGTLDIYNITASGSLQLATRVPVGMEPVAVAVKDSGEVWVVNHLSDSVSVVSLDGTPRVTRTLLVGDEPRDIVFAGSPLKAFITTAHRGQHRTDPSLAGVPGAGDPQILTKSVPRADVWVFNTANLGNALGGVPQKIMSFFADTPRALAVTPDKTTVYVAALKSGNQTTTAPEQVVCDGFKPNTSCIIKGVTYPGGMLGPKTNAEGKAAPETSLIVKYDNVKKKWLDPIGRDWSKAILFNLPDKDVFAVDANALTEKTYFQHVGTTLYNMAVNPVNGSVYVSNTEANNLTLFEGPGVYGKSTVQGHLAEARITVINNGAVKARHLNKHLDYSKLPSDPGYDFGAKEHTLATPLDMNVTKDGKTLYVAAFGSSKIGVFNTADLENDTFQPRSASSNYITVSGGGPAGLVLDENRGLMYVLTRFDNAVKVVNLATKSEVATASMPNPEPSEVVEGRRFLYDAYGTSANGEASCSSCHIFGDEDALAWNLGNPDDKVTTGSIPGKFVDSVTYPVAKLLFGVKGKINGSDNPKEFHPMKGPMTTQTLRGMQNTGAQHWRGDRSVGVYGNSIKDATTSFINFGVAFEGLLGNTEKMSEANMRKFAAFQLKVMMPPNPIRALDNQLTASQARGKAYYTGARPADGVKLINTPTLQTSQNCNGCHTLDPAQGFYGTSGNQSFEGELQIFKVAQLRNVYQRVGMFGAPASAFFGRNASPHQGDQIRGFGFTHDGAVDTLFDFFTAIVFRSMGSTGFPSDKERNDVVDFMFAYENDIAPIVGQQVTLNSSNASAVGARIDMLKARAKASFVSKEMGGTVTECDLVATVVQGGTRKGFYYNTGSDSFQSVSGGSLSDSALRGLASTPGQEVTYTCSTPGSGQRLAQAFAN